MTIHSSKVKGLLHADEGIGAGSPIYGSTLLSKYDETEDNVKASATKGYFDLARSKIGMFLIFMLLSVLGLTQFLDRSQLSTEMPDEIAPSNNGFLSGGADAVVIQSKFRCVNDDDCKRQGAHETPWCDRSNHLDTHGFCRECIGRGQCGEYEDCNEVSKKCGRPSVTQLPSVSQIEFGYDAYKADPFFEQSNTGVSSKIDPGIKTRRLFELRYEVDANTVWMRGNEYTPPEGYDMAGYELCSGSTETKTITSTEEHTKTMESAVEISASGKKGKTKLGGGVGSSAYLSTFKSTEEHKTSTHSQTTCRLYTLTMLDKLKGTDPHTLALTKEADTIIQNLPPQWNEEWMLFFESYGTHITSVGIFGAYKRVTYKFTSKDKQVITEEGKTFEASVSASIPFVFSGSGSSSDAKTEENIKKLKESEGYSKWEEHGNVDDVLTGPVIIKRTLSSFCEFLDYSDITSFTMDQCYENTKQYCIHVLEDAGYENVGSKCEIPDGNMFDCIFDGDCTDGKRCWNMMCTTPISGPDNCDPQLMTRRTWTGCTLSGWAYCDSDFVQISRLFCKLGFMEAICEREYTQAYYCYNHPWLGATNLDGVDKKIGCEYTAPVDPDALATVTRVSNKYGSPSLSLCKMALTNDPI